MLSDSYFVFSHKIRLTLNKLDELWFELSCSTGIGLWLLSWPKSRAFHLLYEIGVNRVEVRVSDHSVLRDQQAHKVLVLLENAEVAVFPRTNDLKLSVGNLFAVFFESLQGIPV